MSALEDIVLMGDITKLRELTTNDAEVSLGWRLGDRARYLNKGAQTVSEQENWIVSREAAGDLNFIIEYCNKPVGMIALHDISVTHRSAVMGRFLIGEQALVGNAPVAFEAELLLLDYAFNILQLHKVYGDIREDNLGVIKLRKYLGYNCDGVLRDHYHNGINYVNAVAVSMLEDEYWEFCRPKLKDMIEFSLKFNH